MKDIVVSFKKLSIYYVSYVFISLVLGIATGLGGGALKIVIFGVPFYFIGGILFLGAAGILWYRGVREFVISKVSFSLLVLVQLIALLTNSGDCGRMHWENAFIFIQYVSGFAQCVVNDPSAKNELLVGINMAIWGIFYTVLFIAFLIKILYSSKKK